MVAMMLLATRWAVSGASRTPFRWWPYASQTLVPSTWPMYGPAPIVG